MTADKTLKIFLWIIAIHSFLIGIVLVSGTTELFQKIGFPYYGGFFAVLGGVFYTIMAVAYIMTAYNLRTQNLLIWFCIATKLMLAASFIMYYVVYEQIGLILGFGVIDLMFGLLLLQFYSRVKSLPVA